MRKKFDIEAIDILGQPWTIVVTDNHPYIEGNFGFAKYETNTIYIMESCSWSQQMSALLHEIIHIISFQLGLGITEEQTQCLETGLYQVTHVNKIRF